MSPAGYYSTSMKEAKARAARIAERKQAAGTVEGKRATAKRLAAKKAAARARMTPQERHSADRREQEAFTAKRVVADQVAARAPGIKSPTTPKRVPGLAEKMLGGAKKKRDELLDALGRKK